MITVFGGQTSRSLRVVWLMEKMLAPIPDAEFLAGEAEQACLARATGRDAFKRAMETSHAGVAGS